MRCPITFESSKVSQCSVNKNVMLVKVMYNSPYSHQVYHVSYHKVAGLCSVLLGNGNIGFGLNKPKNKIHLVADTYDEEEQTEQPLSSGSFKI